MRGQLPRALRFAGGAVRDAARLVLPLTCAGCGGYDEAICGTCQRALTRQPMRADAGAPLLQQPGRLVGQPLPVWAAAPYDGVIRNVILAVKKTDRVDAVAALAAAGRAAATALLAHLGPEVGQPLLVVPAPSRSAAIVSRRATDLAWEVAAELAVVAAAAGYRSAVAPVLRHRRVTRDQLGLGRLERAANLRGAISVARSAAAALDGVSVLLADDVVTTGATLAECRRALMRAGAQVRGAAVLAATAQIGPLVLPNPADLD